MKKALKFIKKNDTIICFVSFFITMMIIAQSLNSIDSVDYLWNFQSIYKMYNGYEIYKDINVIVTPFMFYVGLAFFKVIGANFLTFNIYGAIVNSLLVTYIYKICKQLKCSRIYSIFVAFGIYMLIAMTLIANGPNYNYIALLFILMGVNLEIKENRKKRKYTDCIHGVICFLALFTKHNIGAYYLIAFTIFKLIKDKKSAIKGLAKQYGTIGALGIVFLIYLKISNTWDGFFYYVLSGVGDFKNNLVYKTDYKIILYLPVVVLVLTIIGIIFKKFKGYKKHNIELLISMCVVSLGFLFPIVNNAHILMMSVVNIITIAYIVYLLIPRRKINSFIKNAVKVIMFAIIILVNLFATVFITTIYQKVEYIEITEKESPFYKAKIPTNTYEGMNIINSYIKSKEEHGINVIVIYELSGQYMIPLKKNNGKFDCLNTGNLGKDAGEGVIEEIKQMKNTDFLIISNEAAVFYQQPKEVRKYIQQNLKYTGEIGMFSIYETK